MITRNSGELRFAFLMAVYAVKPEHANEVAASGSTPSSFAKYLELGIKE